ncbi:MAG: hypothetical protein WD316_12880 [Phycisphaeraceae bacterium]
MGRSRAEGWVRSWQVASRSNADPLSLSLLGATQELTNIHESWRGYFNSSPTIRFGVAGLDDADWQLLHDWVYPGERW